MKLLRQGSVIKVTKPQNVEDFIKDLLQSPEELGKKMFVTKLIFSARGLDGRKLRDKIHNWLGKVDIKETSQPKPSWKKSKGSNGKTAK